MCSLNMRHIFGHLAGSRRAHLPWSGFSEAVQGEWVAKLESVGEWNAHEVAGVGQDLAGAAGEIWFDED